MSPPRRSLPSSEPGTANLDQLRVQHATLRSEFRKYKGRMTAWWRGLDREQRLEFLLGWCPYMPLGPGKGYCMVEGRRVDVHGAALVVPEFNQEELVAGDKLMEVLAHIAEPPADPEDAAAGSSSNSPEDAPIPLDPFTQLCYQEMPMAQHLVGRIQTQLPPNLQRNGMVQFMPGKDFGTPLEIKVMVPAIKRMFEMGAMVSALAFEALMYRLGLLLSSAAMCVDEFRMEVLGKQYKAVGPSLGCAGCGKAEGEEGKKLAACASCGVTFYCGKECQRTHWKDGHKAECRAWAQQKAARTAEAAAAADAEGAATCSSTTAGGSGSAAGSSSSAAAGGEANAANGSGASSSAATADAAAEGVARLQVQ